MVVAALGMAPAVVAAGAAQPQPGAIVRRAVDRLHIFLAARNTTTPAAMRDFLDQAIAPLCDFEYMGRRAAGPYARRLDVEQRGALTRRMRGWFLDALARNLGSDRRPVPRVDVYPARRANGSGNSVVTAMVPLGATWTRIDFRFHPTAEGWRIFDVVANGASATAFYRSYFTRLLRRYGPHALAQ